MTKYKGPLTYFRPAFEILGLETRVVSVFYSFTDGVQVGEGRRECFQ